MDARKLVVAAVAGVAGAAVGVAGPAVGSGGHDHGRTVAVFSVPQEENFVDNGDSGPTLGDVYVFSSTLKRNGQQVGHAGVVCTITTSAGESECVATGWFDGKGQISVQGLVPGNEPSEFWLAITGGTGAYSGASGTLHVKELGGGRERLIFHLED